MCFHLSCFGSRSPGLCPTRRGRGGTRGRRLRMAWLSSILPLETARRWNEEKNIAHSIFNSYRHRRSPWPARLKTRKEKLPTLSPCLFTVSDFVFYIDHFSFHKSPCKWKHGSSLVLVLFGFVCGSETRADSMSSSIVTLCNALNLSAFRDWRNADPANLKFGQKLHFVSPAKQDRFFIFWEIKKPLVPYLHENWLCLCCKPNEADDSLFDFQVFDWEASWQQHAALLWICQHLQINQIAPSKKLEPPPTNRQINPMCFSDDTEEE